MKKIILKNTPVVLKNTDFQTIQIEVMFLFKSNVEDLAKLQLLPSMINHMNNKFPTEELMQKEKKRLYILSCSMHYTETIGEYGAFVFSIIIPDKKALGKDLIEEQIKFFKEFIYNPLISEDGFSSFELEREINNLKLAISNALKNVRPYHNVKLKELFDDVGLLSKDVIYHQELIDEVTTSNLYDYYLKTIKKNQPIIYIMGNVDHEVSDLCSKHLYLDKFKENHIEAELFNFFNIRDKITDVVEKSNFKDSIVSFVYKVKDMKENEYVYLNLVRDLLVSLSSRLLNKKLRDENELVYSSKAVSYPHYGAFELTAFINKDNVDIVKEKFHEVMNDFKDTEMIEPLLENIKDRKRINVLRKLDDKYLIFEDFIVSDLGIDDTTEEYYELVKKVTAKDISNFVDRFVLDTIYFLEEEEHE